MSKETFIVNGTTLQKGVRIVAVGIGVGGSNMIEHLSKEDFKGIEFIVAKIKTSAGNKSALKSYDELRMSLGRADIVLIIAGLGGGTGTCTAPAVAQIAKKNGALSIAVVTTPFKFEGDKRRELAKKGLEALRNECDAIVVIPNDRLLSIIDRRLGRRESYKIVDSALAQVVRGISGFILSDNKNDVNLDLSDLQALMHHRGMSYIGVGEHQGEYAAKEAVESAMESPLLDNKPIHQAVGMLFQFHIHPDFPMTDLTEAMEVVLEKTDEDAQVIFCTATDENIPKNSVRITLMATWFDKDSVKPINNIDYSPIQPKI